MVLPFVFTEGQQLCTYVEGQPFVLSVSAACTPSEGRLCLLRWPPPSRPPTPAVRPLSGCHCRTAASAPDSVRGADWHDRWCMASECSSTSKTSCRPLLLIARAAIADRRPTTNNRPIFHDVAAAIDLIELCHCDCFHSPEQTDQRKACRDPRRTRRPRHRTPRTSGSSPPVMGQQISTGAAVRFRLA